MLYQPLTQSDRLAAQIAVETLVTPLMIGVAGLVMLGLSVLLPYDPVSFSQTLLLAFGYPT